MDNLQNLTLFKWIRASDLARNCIINYSDYSEWNSALPGLAVNECIARGYCRVWIAKMLHQVLNASVLTNTYIVIIIINQIYISVEGCYQHVSCRLDKMN